MRFWRPAWRPRDDLPPHTPSPAPPASCLAVGCSDSSSLEQMSLRTTSPPGTTSFLTPSSSRTLQLRPMIESDIGPNGMGRDANAILWVRDDLKERYLVYYVCVPPHLRKNDRAGVMRAVEYVRMNLAHGYNGLAPIVARTPWCADPASPECETAAPAPPGSRRLVAHLIPARERRPIPPPAGKASWTLAIMVPASLGPQSIGTEAFRTADTASASPLALNIGQWEAAGFGGEVLLAMPPDAIVANKLAPRRGKIPGRYIGGDGWVGFRGWSRHTVTAEDRAEWRAWPGAGLCIRTATLPVFDIDVEDPDLADRIAKLVLDRLGHGAVVRTRDGSPRVAILFRSDSPVKRKRCEFTLPRR